MDSILEFNSWYYVPENYIQSPNPYWWRFPFDCVQILYQFCRFMVTYHMPNLMYMHTYILVFTHTLSYSRTKRYNTELHEVLKALIRYRLALFLPMVLSSSSTGGEGQFPVLAFSLLVLHMLTYLCATDFQRFFFLTTVKAQIRFVIFHNTEIFSDWFSK